MAEKTKYETPGNHNLHIPSREEFHRYSVEWISEADFCTDFPGDPGRIINKIASALNWSKNPTKWKFKKFGKGEF